MADPGGRILLQVCPNDHPPFREICRCHALAALSLGWEAITVFLAPPRGAPLEGAHYLNAVELGRTRRLARALRRVVEQALAGAGAGPAGAEAVLALCHRYRAYRVLLASGLATGRIVTVAHEFGFFSRMQRRLAVRLQRLRRRDGLIFAGVSDAVQRELMAVVPDARLLPNPLDLECSDAQRLERGEARRLLGLPEAGFAVGVVGRLHRKKDPLLALAGFREAAADMPGAQLIFIGSGELAASLQRQARQLPVTFAGFVPDAARCLSGLDLLLLPSSGAEAFGMVVLEAMAAGVPVLSSPAPGPAFVLGDTGMRFQPATPEALADGLRLAHEAWCSGDLSERARMARRRAESVFSVPAAAARLVDLTGSASAQ